MAYDGSAFGGLADDVLRIGLESLRRTGTHELGVWVYNDMCSLRGPIFSPRAFEELFLPAYHCLIGKLKQAGRRYVMLHSDGNLDPLPGLLVAAW